MLMDILKKPFKKNISEIPIEQAHQGSGSRQLILSSTDIISKNIEAMTKGYLEPGGVFDWHQHDNIDEFFIVLNGAGIVKYADGTELTYVANEVIYNPANLSHRIENTDSKVNEFFFIRVSV
ncbi:MAG: hypothetical protein UR25_C0001G0157 [Candidatus Nomurabacteria bacterium GW2011_GWE1_32_28]|uniref:Cupin type-2 domain-containing protein n=1 Tax=Candidatus Nomurabacteria bacterium GW2011_GWF1_31_48 TaxID=1618767 RepID=A0A0F9YWA4_9BACT|nr:MAG: hypothetical protein UR10_C0001G0110 [Candidatus Nomurabacteria bacterium GW2011_GWF2_30_133]KKP28988.1 MAG: hypothetical protein UR18_C0001G0109 [Candidatus Nomurabacteria bacterium GW2011_GWE2_31_40]KKP30726.1 MAG: hypothetical protein UR19_C0001G0110 [Candidatus Nomurabacteria bacterium GW2011_GWF1_31_48]KKP35244.1 MAG: hypothetical protein UR25_C0001G0157 [Candidatus Nomurabacteria bacterium GW2011_GWE1_32_28]HAS80550.1 hypothetical protein [Candidatus Nomurabacteria bacterium]